MAKKRVVQWSRTKINSSSFAAIIENRFHKLSKDSFFHQNIITFKSFLFHQNIKRVLTELLMRRNFSFVARYSLKFIRYSLLVVKSLITRCKIRSLLVAEVSCCKNLLVALCRSCLFQKITSYSLQNSLDTRCRSCLLQKITR